MNMFSLCAVHKSRHKCSVGRTAGGNASYILKNSRTLSGQHFNTIPSNRLLSHIFKNYYKKMAFLQITKIDLQDTSVDPIVTKYMGFKSESWLPIYYIWLWNFLTCLNQYNPVAFSKQWFSVATLSLVKLELICSQDIVSDNQILFILVCVSKC